ncbi:hypothetical protein FB567DRAFT_594549 [Paraphoma chrysanthemicola]|uniref:Rhodopsin domain-containing protein n=1 Tax=Paraphoma chrysanthemicola TaxID=798071 RepID=A0A8K0R1I8_9PLEO|nr:hypothetical protein FB567DRAFT_594549 [Paraphoma chrysanthemicola]
MIAIPETTRYPPEYLNEDIGPSLFATCIVFLALESVFMILMIASRYVGKAERTNRSMEVFLSLTYVVCTGKITIMILLVELGGAGRHRVALPPSTVQNALKLSTALQIVCPLTTSLSKLGVLCLLHRILGRTSRGYRLVIRSTFGVVLVVMVVQVLYPFLNCRPFSKTWIPQKPGGCAITSLSLWRYLSIPNVLTTLVVVGIPLPALTKLQVSRSVKLGFVAVFLVCTVGVIAAIMRLRAFLKVADFHDITFENVEGLCWTVAESGIYLIAGTMLTLKPLLRKLCKGTIAKRLFGDRRKHSNSGVSEKPYRSWYRSAQDTATELPKTQRSGSDATSISQEQR